MESKGEYSLVHAYQRLEELTAKLEQALLGEEVKIIDELLGQRALCIAQITQYGKPAHTQLSQVQQEQITHLLTTIIEKNQQVYDKMQELTKAMKDELRQRKQNDRLQHAYGAMSTSLGLLDRSR